MTSRLHEWASPVMRQETLQGRERWALGTGNYSRVAELAFSLKFAGADVQEGLNWRSNWRSELGS